MRSSGHFFLRTLRSADASRLIQTNTSGVTRIRWIDWLDIMFRTIEYEKTMTVHVCTDCNPQGMLHERKTNTCDTRWCRNCDHNSEGHLCEIDGNVVYHWDWHNNEHPGRSYSDVPFPSNTEITHEMKGAKNERA